jgi:hypothetical protein
MLEAFNAFWVQFLLLCFFGLGILWPVVFFYVVRRALRDLRRIADACDILAEVQDADYWHRHGARKRGDVPEVRDMPLSQFGR